MQFFRPPIAFSCPKREFQEPGNLDTRCVYSTRRRKRHARDVYVCITFILETERAVGCQLKSLDTGKSREFDPRADAEKRRNVYRVYGGCQRVPSEERASIKR